jgi:hypothetical protein
MSSAPGIGNNIVFTWRKNATGQTLTCTITGNVATSCNDSTHSFLVAQGDLLTIQLVSTGIIAGTPNLVLSTQFGTTGSNGTVNTGTTGQIAYYAANGTAVSGSVPISDPFGYMGLPGATFRSINGSAIALGQVDLYTAPAGKRAFLMGSIGTMNTTVGNITLLPEVKIGGNYYRLNTTATNTLAGFSNVAGFGSLFILEPGDGISVSTSALGLNVFLRVMEFPSTYAFYSPRLTTFVASTNTLYTVPTGKSSNIVGGVSGLSVFTQGDLFYSNQSGGAVTLTLNIVPSGGVVGAGNQASVTALSTANNAVQDFKFQSTMTDGDFINLTSNSATAGQLAFVTVVETAAN